MPKKPLPFFFVGSIVVFLFLVILLALFGKDEAFLLIHRHRLGLLDATMPYLTYLGDGLLFCFLFPVLYYAHKKAAWHMLISGVFVLVLVQVLKLWIFPHELRPFTLIAHEKMYLIPYEEMHANNSFPSGHTASAFVLFGVLAYYFKKPFPQISLLLLACITAWSRIYLGQHFVGDVAAGFCIGLLGVWVGKLSVGKIR